MKEKTVNINNFIGIYDNYITAEECNKAIKLYEDQNKFNNTINRIGGERSSILQKQDQQFFAAPNNMFKNSKNITYRRLSCLAYRTWTRL